MLQRPRTIHAVTAAVSALLLLGGMGQASGRRSAICRRCCRWRGHLLPVRGQRGVRRRRTTTSTSPTRRRPRRRLRSSASSHGVATIDLVATQDLDRFNLDLRGLDVQAVTINGKLAAEVPVPLRAPRSTGAAYWQVQDDAARAWELDGPAPPEAQEGPAGAGRRDLRRRRPPGPPTSRARSTAGSPPGTAPWSSASPTGR